jgi:hypothetical protein
VVLDDVDEFIDEPNFNNHNTSPDPPSPYADLEKKYRKNRFNKSRNKGTTTYFSIGGNSAQPPSKNAQGSAQQKRKPKKKTFSKSAAPKSARPASDKRKP